MPRIARIALGAATAAAVNGLLFLGLHAAGLFGPQVVATAAQAPLSAAPVVVASAAGVIGAAGTRFVLGALFKPQVARGVFLGLSAVLLVLSFASPLQNISGASLVELLTLELMHVTAGLAAVASVEWATRPRWDFGERAYRERDIELRTALVTSFLGRVCMTGHLRLAPQARIVNVAAAEKGHVPRYMRSELRQPEDIGSGMKSHGQAQLANDLWTASLARAGLGAYGYGPGSVRTDIRRELPSLVVSLMEPLFWASTRSAREAALDIVRLLLDADLPRDGFASRDGTFTHDTFVLDPSRQDALVSLAERLSRQALARPRQVGETAA